MSADEIPKLAEYHQAIHNVSIWLDESQRPREYAGLDWVNARSLIHPLLELAEPTGEELMVDIGTGTGAILNYLAPHVRSAIGIDISRPMLQQAGRNQGNTALVQADAHCCIPLRAESVDIVTTRMMMHDLEDPLAAIEQAWELVKPGGKFIAAEFVMDIPGPAAVAFTDAFEGGHIESSLITADNFGEPSSANISLNRELFTLKQEPDRFLWKGCEFRDLCQEAVGPAAQVEMHFSVAPFNSVANWLGKSGFGVGIKQSGIMMYLAADPALRSEMGMVVTKDGKPVQPLDHDALLEAYFLADEQGRETMNVDVKINRAFVNIVATKPKV